MKFVSQRTFFAHLEEYYTTEKEKFFIILLSENDMNFCIEILSRFFSRKNLSVRIFSEIPALQKNYDSFDFFQEKGINFYVHRKKLMLSDFQQLTNMTSEDVLAVLAVDIDKKAEKSLETYLDLRYQKPWDRRREWGWILEQYIRRKISPDLLELLFEHAGDSLLIVKQEVEKLANVSLDKGPLHLDVAKEMITTFSGAKLTKIAENWVWKGNIEQETLDPKEIFSLIHLLRFHLRSALELSFFQKTRKAFPQQKMYLMGKYAHLSLQSKVPLFQKALVDLFYFENVAKRAKTSHLPIILENLRLSFAVQTKLGGLLTGKKG